MAVYLAFPFSAFEPRSDALEGVRVKNRRFTISAKGFASLDSFE
jgi:hypothetical protein